MTVLKQSLYFIYNLLSRQYKKRALGISFLLFLNSGLELLGLGAIIPVFVVLLEDNVVEKYSWAKWLFEFLNLTDEKQLIVAISIGLFCAFLIKNLMSLWIVKKQTTFSASLFKELLLRMHSVYYRKGFSFFKETNSNIIMRDLKAATEKFAQTTMQSTITLINEIIILLAILVFLVFYNYQIIILLGLVVFPISIIFYRWVRKKSLEISIESMKIDPVIWSYIFESIHGYIDVIVSNTEEQFRKRIGEKADTVVSLNIRGMVYNLAPAKVIESSLMLAVCLIVSFGIYYLPSKTELLKLLGLFVVAGYRIIPSISKIMIAFNGLNQTSWVFDVLDVLNNSRQNDILIEKELPFETKLELQNASYKYKDATTNIFKNVSLRINKGDIVGLTGESGSGKTTLMNLILGFLKPTTGSFLVDDTILTNENERSYYSKIGYVQQQVYLIDGTLAENVAFGIRKDEIDLLKLNTVLEKSSLNGLVAELPNGIHTMVGENGAKLSGGQRQRIGIARALYFDSEILFFDEATSSLDDKTEKEITSAIENLSNGKITIIIIAHRLSTLKNCDYILKLNNNSEIKKFNFEQIIEMKE